MNLQDFYREMEERWKGNLFTVEDARSVDNRAKEYLYRLNRLGRIERIRWGWYYIPSDKEEVWDFLTNDRGFKVVIRQTAASIWNYDFVHRNVYHLAVKDSSYKEALEEFAKNRGWIFEVEQYDDLEKRIPYRRVDGLLVEIPESTVVSCIVDWSFLDAFATLHFRRSEISLKKIMELGRWRRVSKTRVRAWQVTKYGCNLFNVQFGKIFDAKKTSLDREDIRELVEEAVEKVIEFA